MALSEKETIDQFLNDIKVEKEKSEDPSYSESLISIQNEANDVLKELQDQKIIHIFSLKQDYFKNSNIISSVGRLKKEVTSVHFTKESVDNNNLLNQMKKILNNFKIIKYLFDFSQHNKNIVICGSNGSGKSTFASFLKNSYLSNLIVLPAQKFLYYNDVQNNQNKTLKDVEDEQQTDFTNIVRNDNGQQIRPGGIESVNYEVFRDLTNRFTMTITSIVNNHTQALIDWDSVGSDTNPAPKTFFKKAKELWKHIFPKLSLIPDSSSRILKIKNMENGQKYSVNSLSDGEKSCLYYIASIVIAPENSFIVVDEPETYMNPAIYNKLWDMLINARSDCQFIFISHNKDFIASRSNATVLWIKSFFGLDSWDLQEIQSQKNIPIELLIALVGSSKDVLFCEGEASSWDNKVYSQLFIENKTVIPAGGHDQVIQYTQSVNSLSSKLNIKAVGIVDGDGKDNVEIKKLKEKNVFVMPFNEIEMLFLSKEVVLNVLECFDLEERFDSFKRKFFSKISENREPIILNILGDRINYLLSNRDVSNRKSLENIKKSVNDNNIKDETIDSGYNELKDKIDDIIQKEKYPEALRMCNLKGQITKKLANCELDSDYVNKALTRIEKDSDLRSEIINKYFPDIKNS